LKRQSPYDTSVGIQRDDIYFSLGGHALKSCGSQGQQKTYLLALKLAQFALIKQMKEVAPILLLDDVFDKLDAQRVSRLLHLVVEDGLDRFSNRQQQSTHRRNHSEFRRFT